MSEVVIMMNERNQCAYILYKTNISAVIFYQSVAEKSLCRTLEVLFIEYLRILVMLKNELILGV